MNIFEIQEQLQDTEARLAGAAKAVEKNPSRTSLAATVRSLEKRRQLLERDFLKAADQNGVDVCCYRAFGEPGAVRASPALQSIVEFQNAFSVTFDAHKNGPKQRGTIPQQTFQDTAFGFGYAFTGSLGIVLTLPNERLLFSETIIDAAIGDIFAMAKAKTSEDILTFAKRLGVPPINAVYKWAGVQAKHSLGADVDWRRGSDIRAKLFVQYQELDQLQRIIVQTSDETEESVSIVGTLDNLISTRHSFTLAVEGGSITGTYGDAIGPEHTVEVPGKKYRAVLRKTTKTIFSTGEVNDTYFLTSLKPV